MTEQDAPSSEKDSGDERAPGRTAFDALNPYGDFGGPSVSRGQLLLLGTLCALTVGGVLAVGGVWATDLFSRKPTKGAEVAEVAKAAKAPPEDNHAPGSPTAGSDAPGDERASDTDALPDEVAASAPVPEEEPPVDTAPPPAPPAPPPAPPARGVTASSSESSASSTSRAPAQARPTARPEGPRSRASQAQTQRRLVLSSVRDHSKSSASGLDAALERGFLERLANVAPALRLERGRPRTDDLALRVMLLRLDEGGGRGAHDVTARCALDARPREALPNGALYAQGKQQGVEASDRIRLDAAERCGAQLAEAFAAVVR